MLPLAPTQAQYFLTTVHGSRGLTVREFTLREAVSEPFALTVLATRSPSAGDLDLNALVGTPATFAIRAQARLLPTHGLITEARRLDASANHHLYQVVVEPHLAMARWSVHSRTFVDRSLRDIIGAILRGTLANGERRFGGLDERTEPVAPPHVVDMSVPNGNAFFRFTVADTFLDAPIDMVVQYQESDLAFLTRILSRHGLAYHIEHGQEGACVNITDRVGAEPLFADAATLERSSRMRSGFDGLLSLDRAGRIGPSAMSVSHVSWRNRRDAISGTAIDPDASRILSEHHFVGERDAANVTGDLRVAEARLDASIAARARLQGTGTTVLDVGCAYTVKDVARILDDERIVVTSREVFGRSDGPAVDDLSLPMPSLPPGGLLVHFGATPEALGYRAPQLACPIVAGIQSARISAEEFGPESQPELHCNEMGRVRVRFAWDERPPEPGAPSSAWVRLGQAWGGPGYGLQCIPRVGDEVLVTFINGDPDQPVVVGSLHNIQSPPPYALPEEPHIVGLRTRSTPGGKGHHELRFDDKAGAEQVLLRAQGALNEQVAGSHNVSVGGEENISVATSQRTTIGSHQGVRGETHSSAFSESHTVITPYASLNTTMNLVTASQMFSLISPKISQMTESGARVLLEGNTLVLSAAHIELRCTTFQLESGSVTVNGGTAISLNAPDIHLNP